MVAQQLREAGLGTLLLTLLSPEEQNLDARTACFRFDNALLATRLLAVTTWLDEEPTTRGLPIGYFAGGGGSNAASGPPPNGRTPSVPWSCTTADPIWPPPTWPEC